LACSITWHSPCSHQQANDDVTAIWSKLEMMVTEILLIDDDESVRSYWERHCQKLSKSILTFGKRSDLMRSIARINHSAHLFIDKNFKGKATGLDLSKFLFRSGFKNIYLCTAEPKSTQSTVKWVKGTVGKVPPDWLFEENIVKPLSFAERDHLLSTMTPAQLKVYKSRMEDFLNTLHGMDTGLFAGPDLNGFNMPVCVLNAWERAITTSVDDHELKKAIENAWRLA
jgi:hypothetical protein